MSNLIKKSFLISMVVIFSFWGVIGIVNVSAIANVAVAGDLIKTASNPAVYYLAADGKRYTFNHEREYLTWYNDFAGVVTISSDEMFSYSIQSTVVLRPGARLMQYVSLQGDGTWLIADPKVYAVGASGTINHLDSAATAAALYGSNWETKIVAIPDYLAGYYTAGDQLTSSSLYPTGTLVKTADSSQVYYISDSTKRPVTDAGFTANNFNMDYVVTVTSLASYTDSTSITALEGDIANPIGGAGVTPIGTGLTVAIASTSPSAQVAPILATNVPLMQVNLTASSDGAVTVNTLVFKRQGVGDTNDFAYLYLYDGATRLTSGKTINTTTNEATFSNLNVQIAAGTTKLLTLSGDVNNATYATSGGIHYFGLTAAASISTTATVNGTFPINSDTTTIGSAAAGYITIERNGTLTNPTVAQTNVKVAQFKATVSSAEDMLLNRVSLYHAGTVDNAYLTNLKLYQGTTLLAETSGINSDSLAVFNLATPFTVAKNTNKIFYVYADLGGGSRNNDTVKFYLDNESDLYAVGATYGYGACVDAGTTTCSTSAAGTYDGNDTTCTSQDTCSDSSYTVVQGGTVTVANNGPAAGSLTKGQSNVPLLKFAITSGVNLEIKKWRIELHATDVDFDTDDAYSDCYSTTNYYRNIRIVDDAGGAGTSAVDCANMTEISGSDNGLYTTFTDTVNIAAGQTKNYTIYMDLSTSVSASTTYVVLGQTAATAFTFDSTSLKNTDNNQYITDIVPSTKTQGTNQAIQSSSLSTALGNYRGEVTAVKGSTNVKFVEYQLTAGAGSAVTINSIKWGAYVNSSGASNVALLSVDTIYAKDVVTKARMYSSGVQIGTEKSIDSSGWLEFTNLNWTIPADTNKTVELKGDISSNAYYNSTADRVTFDILTTSASATYIDAVDADGNTITTVTAERNGVGGSVGSNSTTAGTGACEMSSSYSYVTVQNTGTLNAYSYTQPSNALVVAGTTGVEVLKVRFHAANENLKVTKLRIQDDSATTYHRALDSITISYPDAAGATKTKTETLFASGTAAYAQFSDLDLYIANNSDAILTVKASYKTITPSGAQTGDPVQLSFSDGSSASSFEVKGADSGSNTVFYETSNLGNIVGNETIIRKTIPSFAKNTVTNTLQNGSTELYKFTVSTAVGSITQLKTLKAYVILNEIGGAGVASLTVADFTIAKNGQALVAGTDFVVKDGYTASSWSTATPPLRLDRLDDAADVSASLSGGDAGTTTAQLVQIAFLTEQSVEATSPVVYSVAATFSNAGSTTSGKDSVTFYLASSDTASTTYNYYKADVNEEVFVDYASLNDASTPTASSTANVIWSDYSGTSGNGAHSTAALGSADWTNGYLLQACLGSTYGNTIQVP